MFRNYFKIGWRNITKSKFYSALNIIGLSTGLGFTLLISAYVWNELRVNKQLTNIDRQYIIQSKWTEANKGIELTTMGPLAKALKESYPDLVANYFRWDGITSNVSRGEKSYREELQICDSTLLNMYGFTLLHGDAKSAFDGPYSLVITSEKAKKYFGKTDVIGQTLTIENFSGSKHDFIITGVLNDPLKNSVTHLNDDNNNQFYISSNNLSYFGRNMDWSNQYIVGFVELQKGVKPQDLAKPMQYLMKQNAPTQIAADMSPYLVSLQDYSLSANDGLVKKMLYALSAIAFFILAMAVINFINLSVSRSATRMREIGIRKVLGGLKKQLIIQFLIESIIIVFFSMIFAILFFIASRNLFGNILGKSIPSLGDFPLIFIAFPLLLTLLIGFFAGIYPAFVLSSLKSVESLKGKLSSINENAWLRKGLVAFQFGTAIVVFIGAMIISSQIRHFLSKDLGFNKEYVLSAQIPRDWTPQGVSKAEDIRKQFAAMPEVQNATLSFSVPGGNYSGTASVYKVRDAATSAIASDIIVSDENYTSTFGIAMAAGNFFSASDILTNPFTIVINVAQAKALGWENANEAVGKQVKFQTDGENVYTISGVTKDFHFGSMQKAIQPTTFMHVSQNTIFRFLSFKIKPGNVGNSLAALQKKWSSLMPGTPFEYSFMDESLAKLYRSELQLKKAGYTATALALILVWLGVVGLISLSIQKRTKEIGIRKVLGSSAGGIMSLFIKDFLPVILIAGLVACPLAYFIMKKWLQEYAYRIDISGLPFVISIAGLTLVTALLICIQTLKVAKANPVESLRGE